MKHSGIEAAAHPSAAHLKKCWAWHSRAVSSAMDTIYTSQVARLQAAGHQTPECTEHFLS